MAKKFIEFLEAAALIILTAACVVGVMKHLDSRTEEPTEDTPIVEELPGEETPEVESVVATFVHGDQTYTYIFENGTTWKDFLYLPDDFDFDNLDHDADFLYHELGVSFDYYENGDNSNSHIFIYDDGDGSYLLKLNNKEVTYDDVIVSGTYDIVYYMEY